MLISQLEAKLDSQLASITSLETQILEINKIVKELKDYRNKLLSDKSEILEINKIVKELKDYRNKLLSDKSEIYWEAEDTIDMIARLKEGYHIC